ncbi:MAG: STAS domain-containing protein [Micromonosporaceae bacterium]|nr:STAS domain-containing protein [Micromonosporaceae bacterium]
MNDDCGAPRWAALVRDLSHPRGIPVVPQTSVPPSPRLATTHWSIHVLDHSEQTGELAAVRVEPEDDGVRAVLNGELDMSNADEIYQRLLTVARDNATLVVDLSDLMFIDSAGVAALDRLARTAPNHCGLRIAARPGSIPARTLSLAGMDQVLPMAPPSAL